MRNTEETRAFLAAIKEEGGSASTRQIRHRTDLTEGQLQHQYKKLEDHGWIAVEKPESYVTESGSRMKVAELTEKALDEINNKAFLSGGQQPERTTVNVAELAEQVQKVEESIEQVQEYVSENVYRQLTMMRRSLARVELALEDASVDLGSLDGNGAKESELKQRARDFGVQEVDNS
jgi:DNA-binding MarR family transcriptional regulator